MRFMILYQVCKIGGPAMTQCLYTIPVLFMMLLYMIFLTATNEFILARHKKGFLIAFIGEFFITICEMFSIFLNGSAITFKPLHFLSNYLGFLLTPILIILFASSIGNFRRFKGALISIITYFVLLNCLVVAKQLFFIDAQNNYHRGFLFPVYVVSYFLAVIYLLYETLRYSRKGFLQHKIFAYLLSFFFLASISIQVFYPQVYMSRIAVVMCLSAYYAYNIELANLFDKLTGILNQGAYLRKVKYLKEGQIVIILDIDNFKVINDNYGHRFGDECLRNISRTIKSVFGNHGQCYRIGGDEFAVILKRYHNVEDLINSFEIAVADLLKTMPCRLSISLGYSKYENNDSCEAVVQRADSNMYNAKKQKKALATTVLDAN